MILLVDFFSLDRLRKLNITKLQSQLQRYGENRQISEFQFYINVHMSQYEKKIIKNQYATQYEGIIF